MLSAAIKIAGVGDGPPSRCWGLKGRLIGGFGGGWAVGEPVIVDGSVFSSAVSVAKG